MPLQINRAVSGRGIASVPPYRLKNCIREDFADNIAADVRDGLTGSPKSIPSKYFYDARGSELFERICELPEYYQTRTEVRLIADLAEEIAGSLTGCDLVELGVGSARKIGLLFAAMDSRTLASVRYLPLDVSLAALHETCRGLKDRFPELAVEAYGADFTRQIDLLPTGRPKVLFLFGSTIGNLEEETADAFYAELADGTRPHDRFIIGLDLVKSETVLESAYNDAAGVTADFNRNVLRVVNRELDADFDPESFKHLAYYNGERNRVEMHLRSPEDSSFRIDKLDLEVSFDAGETIRTEICRKFTRPSYERRIEGSGFRVRGWHSDDRNYFALAELVRL